MISVQRGRGGWRINSAWLARGAAVLLVTIALAAAGCSSKSQQPTGAEAANTGAPGVGESGIKGNQNSLTAFQKGQLGAGESGPLSDIHFAFNAYTVDPQDGQILKSNAQWLEQHPNTHVQIEGHCDERGSEEYNIALGARRAQAAKNYLVTLGVAGDRISTISYGKELPLCTEHDEECWARNRRDHFAVTGS